MKRTVSNILSAVILGLGVLFPLVKMIVVVSGRETVTVSAVHVETNKSIHISKEYTLEFLFGAIKITFGAESEGDVVTLRCPSQLHSQDDVMQCLQLYTFDIPPVTTSGWIGGTVVDISDAPPWRAKLYRYSEPHVIGFEARLP